MRKVLVFQHVAHEILGTLNPMLKERGFRVRYVNFDREPSAEPSLDKYNGLIVLGGNMGVYQADSYPHIKVELKVIEEALKRGVPVLGICLGSQMLAHVLGANVRKHHRKELGWCDIELTEEGARDPLLKSFRKRETVFQLHGDTFDVPRSAVHLAKSAVCEGQAFRASEKVYGLQFHLEVDEAMIQRWLKNPHNRRDLEETKGAITEEMILADTKKFVENSLALSRETFRSFIDTFGFEKPEMLGSGHGKPRKAGT